jgi:hypothetical protein
MKDDWINKCIAEYYNWLKDQTHVRKNQQSGWYTITTPFLGLFNDYIEIYAKLNDGRIILSDDGETLSNLELVGVSTRKGKRRELIDMILLNYDVKLNGNSELYVEGTEKEFSQKKYNLTCAILEISDMAVLAKSNKSIVPSLFKADVKEFLDKQNVIYTPQFMVKGKTGMEFSFDFQIAGKERELVIKSFSTLNTSNVPTFLFSWEDVKELREKISGKKLNGLAIINDAEKEIKPEYINALETKGADIIMWSKRHKPDIMNKLVA